MLEKVDRESYDFVLAHFYQKAVKYIHLSN